MIKVAIVEDDPGFQQEIKSYVGRFQEEEGLELETVCYKNGLEFISQYKSADIVLMDIEMPVMDGMEAARRLRELDQRVCLIFITQMAQYAIKGYEVDAMAYMLKPIRYIDFSVKMRKAVKRCVHEEKSIVYNCKGIFTRIQLRDILFVEVVNNRVIFHTEQGDLEQFRTLKSVETEVEGEAFARCSSSYLVNLRKVLSVNKNEVLIGTYRLQISRNRKREFMEQLAMCMGGTI